MVEHDGARANLDYLDPAAVDVAAWPADPHALVAPHAGEELYLVAVRHRGPTRLFDSLNLLRQLRQVAFALR